MSDKLKVSQSTKDYILNSDECFLTAKSKMTGTEFCFKINRKKNQKEEGFVYFVSVLDGSITEKKLKYLGMFKEGWTQLHNKKDTSVSLQEKGFNYILKYIDSVDENHNLSLSRTYKNC
jgi:hypothetical protein